ncbi:mitochondrial glyco protein [Serendipita vermifera]|nr:mitochondrial glyco protein [Serendipita vermifera]
MPSFQTPLAALSARTFTASALRANEAAPEPADKVLVQKITEEINHEVEAAKEDPAVPEFLEEFKKAGIWTIEDKPGQDEVVVTRKYNNETIRVMFSISDVENAEPSFDEEGASDSDEDLGAMFPIRCAISIAKPSGGALSIEATAQDGIFSIDSVSYYKDGKLATDLSADADFQRRALFIGPNFDNLDVAVQEAFESYLEERGIDENLAMLIPEYAAWKEQQEYVSWLNNVKKFVEA